MKFTINVICLSLILNLSIAQNRLTIESEEINHFVHNKETFPKVTGQLLNFKEFIEDGFMIKYISNNVNGAEQETKSTFINENGEFQLEFTTGLPYQQVWLSIGELYYGGLIVNENLKIVADIEILVKDSVRFYGKGIEFQGADAGITSFINNFYKYKSENKEIYDLYHQSSSYMDESIPLQTRINNLKDRNKVLKEVEMKYLKVSNSLEYKWILDEERESKYYGDLSVMHWNKIMNDSLLDEIISYKPTLATSASFSFYRYLQSYFNSFTSLERLKITEDIIYGAIIDPDSLKLAHLFLDEYKKKVKSETFDKEVFRTGIKKYTQKYRKEIFKEFYQLYLDKIKGLPHDKVSILNLVGMPKPVWLKKIYLSKVIPATKHKWCRVEMQKVLAENNIGSNNLAKLNTDRSIHKKNLTLGTFIKKLDHDKLLYSSDHIEILELIEAIRQKNKDKAIILDIWSTWCAPCINDMNRSSLKKEKLKKLGVEVIYLCVNDKTSIELWTEKINSLPIGGTHIFLNYNLSIEVMEKFKLSGFPSYVFIDPLGNYDTYFISSITGINLDDVNEKMKNEYDD